jgi:hypoxanthine-DNA glycosylase
MLTGLAPLVSSQTRLLILGSFPGVASLKAQQYYGHPQNQLWRVLSALLGDIYASRPMDTSASSYQIRSEWLLSKKLGVWDVYASCEREGSLDSKIRQPVLNDFSSLQTLCPDLQAIAHNGGESFKHAKRVEESMQGCAVRRDGPPLASTSPSGGSVLHEVKSVGVQFHKLPSTSPANASWSFERKVTAWRDVFEKCGING